MRRKEQYFVEYASIRPTRTSFYSVPEIKSRSQKKAAKFVVKKCIENRKYVRLQTALNYLLITSENQNVYCKKQKRSFNFKLNFITVTLSEKQKHDDKFIKKYMLDPFLKWIIYKGASGFVWKAERQKNGNIHFHITTNKFIHYKEIRDKWNHIQWKSGYLEKYNSIHNSIDANSTDVKAVVNIDKAVRYIFKYLLKKESGKEPIEGHNYGYSRNFAQIKIRYHTLSDEFQAIHDYLTKITIEKIHYDYVSVLYHSLIDLKKCPDVLRKEILQQTCRNNKKTAKKELLINL